MTISVLPFSFPFHTGQDGRERKSNKYPKKECQLKYDTKPIRLAFWIPKEKSLGLSICIFDKILDTICKCFVIDRFSGIRQK